MLIQVDLRILTLTSPDPEDAGPFRLIEPRAGVQLFLFRLQHAGHEVKVFSPTLARYAFASAFAGWLDLHHFPRHVEAIGALDPTCLYIGTNVEPFDPTADPEHVFDKLTADYTPGK